MRFIIDDIKNIFEGGTKINRLIVINVCVFVAVSLFGVFTHFGSNENQLMQGLTKYTALSNDWVFNLLHPWVFVSSMFLHFDFWHILWNMLFLYWFGRIVGDMIGDKHIYPLYFYGGIVGALTLLLSASIFSYLPDSYVPAYGASAAVMALVMSAGMIAPDYIMHLILIGPVRLKYIVLVVVLMDVMALGSDVNTGGHFAHLGGVALGWFYVYALRNGWTLAPKINITRDKSLKRIPSKRQTTSVSKKGTTIRNLIPKMETKGHHKSDLNEEVDRILIKIKQKGMESLTAEEKETLYQASKK